MAEFDASSGGGPVSSVLYRGPPRRVAMVSQLGVPGEYQRDAFNIVSGGDDPCCWLWCLLREMKLDVGVELVPIRLEHDDPLPDLNGFAGVFLGSSVVSAGRDLPWRDRLARWLRDLRETGLPLLGTGIGAMQALEVLGATVESDPGFAPGVRTTTPTEHPSARRLFSNMSGDTRFYFLDSLAVGRIPKEVQVLATRNDVGSPAAWLAGTWVLLAFQPELYSDALPGMLQDSWVEVKERFPYLPYGQLVLANGLEMMGLVGMTRETLL